MGAVVSTRSHPATMRQDYFLNCLAHPSCTANFADHWILAHATLVRPGVDLRRLQRAAGRLWARHDSLRIRFAQAHGGWRAVIGEASGAPVELIDLGDPGEAFAEAIRRIARRPMDALTGRLAEILLVKCGARGDVLISRVHHTVADGYGMIVLAEELMKFLLNLPVAGAAMSHGEYESRWQFARGTRRAEIDAYWQTVLRDFPPAPGIGRKARGLEPLVNTVGWRDSRKATLAATPASRDGLNARARKLGISPDTLLYTAYAEAMCQLHGTAEIAFQVPVSRAEPELATYCGDRVSMALMRHRAVGGDEIGAAGQHTHARLMQAISHLPAEAAHRGSASDAALIAAGGNPGQFVAKTPRADLRARQSVFRQGFAAMPGDEASIGPYRITYLDVGAHSLATAEHIFAVAPESGDNAFTLGYDVDAYKPDDLKAQALRICALAGLQPEAVTFQ